MPSRLQTLISAETERPPRDRARRSGGSRREAGSWREGVDVYARSHLGRSLVALLTSVVPFIGLWVLMYLSLQTSYLLTLALAVPTAGFLLRTYIIFHDCAHGSFLRGKRANAWLGGFLALLVFTPFAKWRHDHAVHHATAGDLDRRGRGDVPTMTVDEYNAEDRRGHFWYRLFRQPMVMFGIGPIYSMLIMQRKVDHTDRPRIQRSVRLTNLALVFIVGGLCYLIGWQALLLVETPLIALAGGAGIWLFYVQHQFDDVYWERTAQWNYADAALRGSSYLHLPKILQFFTGNIGLHHVHHLSPKIPGYYLQRAHDNNEIFHDVPKVSLWQGLRAVRFKLWDEEASCLVTWREWGAKVARTASPSL
jgi:acyl-lipid omega-6 desaturase (Delta-12 desaturase)